jgi:hypothetical protein
MAYAKTTSVSVPDTIQEIERTLKRYGATSFTYANDDTSSEAMIGFRLERRNIRVMIRLPKLSESGTRAKWEQAIRSRYRALLLVTKAKLEAVESGITTLEREFLPDIVTSSGQTVSEVLAPQIEEMYRTGRVPSLLERAGRPIALLEGTIVE